MGKRERSALPTAFRYSCFTLFELIVAGAVVVCGAVPPCASASDVLTPNPYLSALATRAAELHLADHPQWRALLHYQPTHRGGVRSPAQSAWFFRAPDGRTDPHAELVATLASFFDSAAVVADGEPAQCAFPARYSWLKKQLQFDPTRLPEQRCADFQEWMDAIAPRAVTLVFPEAYMNNPASMFGHTLLRIDTGAPAERADLLAYAVNYAAETGADGGVAFAWKGIVGDYFGFFSIRPYYETVKVYGDWEDRDIWEYGLNLAPDEIDLLLRHIWELRSVAFSYYFFDENCSYELLALLQVARPSARLMERLSTAWVIPVDTVRVAVDETGLVGNVRFRPSAATVLRYRARQLSAANQRLARKVATGACEPTDARLAALSDAERAAVLDVAYDDLRHTYLAKDISREASEGRARRILIARSEVSVTGFPAPPVPAPAVPPNEGHRTARAAVGAGWLDGRFFLEARARPAFHDLLDPEGGYTRGAQIDFLELAGRLYPEDQEVRLERVTLLDIVSVSPRDRFLRPISWKINTGLISRVIPRGADADLAERYVWRTNGGAGAAIEPWPRTLAYAFLEATGDAGSHLARSYAVGPGASAGLFIGPASDWWKGQLFAQVTRFTLGDHDTAARYGFDQRITLAAQTALTLTIAGNRDVDHNWVEGGMFWNFYF